MKDIDNIVEKIFKLYSDRGHQDYIGEPVSQLEHMSQSAQFAIDEGFDAEVILAAFFHDIGHLCESSQQSMGSYGVKDHETEGAHFLEACGFSSRLIRLVENHVRAKRYLTYKYPEYYNGLSEASKKTLDFQGGVMNTEEALQFESDPLFNESVALRRWDDLAKVQNIPVRNLTMLKEICRRVLIKK